MTVNSKTRHIGVDIGSTTAKIVCRGHSGNILFKDYKRHYSNINKTLDSFLHDLSVQFPNENFKLAITGSAGMGLSEKLDIPFIQEVVAAKSTINEYYPETNTLIDIGGEDSKMMFFREGNSDFRMNGNCAGGTGSFIDQAAGLMNVSIDEFEYLSTQAKNIHSIAGRCGVFAKTDMQGLLSDGVSKADIAKSVLHSVVIQTINALSRGLLIQPKILFSGGPLSFFRVLKELFIEKIGIKKEDEVKQKHPLLISAIGASLYSEEKGKQINIKDFRRVIDNAKTNFKRKSETVLFNNEAEYKTWEKNRFKKVSKAAFKTLDKKTAFIGIDSGSTSSKMVLTNCSGEIVSKYYKLHNGEHIQTVRKGLDFFKTQLSDRKIEPENIFSCVTGYGEDLVRACFEIESGVVETLAHFKAAVCVENDVSFVLDIGGQDMKAIFIENKQIKSIEINEACSSGCGSFIQTFADNMSCSLEEFVEMACSAENPVSLGSRCTVFMNSLVKEALRNNSKLEDIAAGLIYSVVKNAIHKLLNLKDISVLGRKIIVQGGSFMNAALQRVFEIYTEKDIICPDISEYMGAYGAALHNIDILKTKNHLTEFNFPDKTQLNNITKNIKTCVSCVNSCRITEYKFVKRTHYSGNRCEKVFSNTKEKTKDIFNFFEYKQDLIFNRKSNLKKNSLKIGIPRVLNLYENYPFWHTLFSQSGFEIIISSESNPELYQKGIGSVMSDSICFPAKLVHGHIQDLVNKNTDRIFYPVVVSEKKMKGVNYSYNCPIVTGYPVVADTSNLNPGNSIHFDMPEFSLRDKKLFKINCYKYFKSLGISKTDFNKAFSKAITEQENFEQEIENKALEIINNAYTNKEKVIVLLGRPYHADSTINMRIPELFIKYNYNVVSVDFCRSYDQKSANDGLMQWSYSNLFFRAIELFDKYSHLEFVYLNSFGCGPDAIITDELSRKLSKKGKTMTILRVDEHFYPGAIKLRIKALIETLNSSAHIKSEINTNIQKHDIINNFNNDITVLIPYFSDYVSAFFPNIFKDMGYKAEILEKSDSRSEKPGLKYSNNEICYPATLIIGEVISALRSGKYKAENTINAVFQTAGQCRMSNYISLIKNALISSGFPMTDVFPIALTAVESKGKISKKPRFKLNLSKFIEEGYFALLYCDLLSQMFISTKVREIHEGESQKILNKSLKIISGLSIAKQKKDLHGLLKNIIEEFNAVECYKNTFPRIGLVGEIYLKHNSYANRDIVNWLLEAKVEIFSPSLTSYALQFIKDKQVNVSSKIERKDLLWIFSLFYGKKLRKSIIKTLKIYKNYKYHHKIYSIDQLAEKAEYVISLVHQYGEGWLIAAEIISYAEEGINNIVCVQPFGCIANQITAKGLEKKLKKYYPKLNLLFLDFDSDTSKANIHNRLHFMVNNAKDEVKSQKKQEL